MMSRPSSLRRQRCTNRSSNSFVLRSCLAMLHSTLFTASVVHAGWIDVDTPKDKRTTTSLIDGSTYHLVMSDEFNVPNRTFKDGHDPMWTALDKSDDDSSAAGGGSQHFYNSSTVTTTDDGYLQISSVIGKTEWNRYNHVKKTWSHEVKNFKSGMIQSWNKFCFTGGIVEVDVIFPGDPSIGGLWPAIWILGNLGRSTYEASTNNIWPWSYDTCDRTKQPKQTISACNEQNHFGMNPRQGRGATEIDIVEVMTGDSEGPLPGTEPPVELPYVDMTLQVAPGVPSNRPQSGAQVLRENTVTANGHTQLLAQTWYEGLEIQGNTSINPFFYGTYLGETKPEEPVTRTKKQAFQADAVGCVHQVTPAHFEKMHTFRIEWQPGKNGRLDWFSKVHRLSENTTVEGDGLGQDWEKTFTIKDESISDLMGSQIPTEPSYLIMNTAISSTWGFPYDTPDWCTKCYDCHDPKCACAFAPGFCNMMKTGQVAMKIDSIRVYQSRDPDAHPGNNHTVGCDPVEYPTKEWIKGHEYRYMRNPPFSYEDKHPLRDVKKGGGRCHRNSDCGGIDVAKGGSQSKSGGDATDAAASEADERNRQMKETSKGKSSASATKGRGECVPGNDVRGTFSPSVNYNRCRCHDGYTGPYCLALDQGDDEPGAYELKSMKSLFTNIAHFRPTPFMTIFVAGMIVSLAMVAARHAIIKRRQTQSYAAELEATRLNQQQPPDKEDMVSSGRSV